MGFYDSKLDKPVYLIEVYLYLCYNECGSECVYPWIYFFHIPVVCAVGSERNRFKEAVFCSPQHRVRCNFFYVNTDRQ